MVYGIHELKYRKDAPYDCSMQPKGLLLILLKAKKTCQEDFLFQRFILITSRLVKGVPIQGRIQDFF